MPTTSRLLVVATMQTWRADELAAAAGAGWAVASSLGLDVPDLDSAAALRWWTPQEHAARLAVSGCALTVHAPHPQWLAELPPRWLRRDVWVGPVEQLHEAPAAAWYKPATVKIDTLPAAWRRRDQMHAWLDAQSAAGHDLSGLMLAATGHADWRWEVRCWIRARQVVGAGVYLADGVAYTQDPRVDTVDRVGPAAAWCQQLLDDGLHVPDGVVVDVGCDRDGRFSVVEANPAWASSWYGVPAAAVLDVLDAAGDPNPASAGRWRWRPDVWLLRRAAAKRPLPAGGRLRLLSTPHAGT